MNGTTGFLLLGILGLGGVAAFLFLSRRQSGGAPIPSASVTYAAGAPTGSSGSSTNQYDAIVGISAALGGVLESGISSGEFSSWFASDDDEPAVVTGDPGILAPGQTWVGW